MISTRSITSATGMRLPAKMYFHISQPKDDGWLIREAFFYEVGNLDVLLSEIDDDTVGVILLEEGIEQDVSEDVAAAWFKKCRNEIAIDLGEALVPDFIRRHAGNLVADLEGEAAVAALNERHFNEHQFSRAS